MLELKNYKCMSVFTLSLYMNLDLNLDLFAHPLCISDVSPSHPLYGETVFGELMAPKKVQNS